MSIKIIEPNTFEQQNHFYEKTLNASRSPTVNSFLNMSITRIVERFSHLNPTVDKNRLLSLLKYKPTYFRWAGADLFNCTTEDGKRCMVLIETNSCPSGQKSMPTIDSDEHEKGGYEQLIRSTFIPLVNEMSNELPDGVFCVLYDKNYMEASGYASTMADCINDKVYLVEYKNKNGKEENSHAKYGKDKILYIKEREEDDDSWIPVKAVFRYVTQKPWNRIPLDSKTLVFNPIIACLAGGRNKLVADIAYEFINSELSDYDCLKLNIPHTIRNVKLNEVPLWIKSFGGIGVVKNPYSNAGQGVWTITNPDELNEFLNEKHEYNEFIVQALIGNYKWSSQTPYGKLFHVGTIPNRQNKIYVADLRMMIHYDYTRGCFKPLVMYARRAKNHLTEYLDGKNSWDILGTNLSVKLGENKWDSDTSRLILMDQKDFDKLGINIDDLINGFIQTVLSVIAIDKMGNKLIKDDKFDRELFKSLNPDDFLLNEIMF